MYKVLLVDDEEIICRGLQVLIPWENHGFAQPSFVTSAHEALALLQGGGFDVVITDIRMPEMDGLSLVRQLRELNFSGGILIISAYRDFEYARTALEYGVKKYLLKPVNENQLVETIAALKAEADENSRRREEYGASRELLRRKLLAEMLRITAPDGLLAERLAELGFAPDSSHFQVCVARGAAGELERAALGADGVYLAGQAPDRITAIVCGGDIGKRLDGLLRRLEGLDATVAVGDRVEGYWLAGRSCRNAEGLDELNFREGRRVVFYDDIREKKVIESILEYSREHCCAKLSLKDLAGMYYLNPAYLGRLFKQHTGKCFMDFISECRVEQAARMLGASSMMVSQVSERVGYQDYNHFCRVFKRYKGCTPSEYKYNLSCKHV